MSMKQRQQEGYICLMVVSCFLVINRCSSVVPIDIDPVKVGLAMNNAMVYGVAVRVDFIAGDFIQLAPSLKVIFFFYLFNIFICQIHIYLSLLLFVLGRCIVLAPPWEGPMYNKVETFTMDMLQPIDG